MTPARPGLAYFADRLSYDPETGEFRHKRDGRLAGSPNQKGYRQIKIDGKMYWTAYLAVLFMTGKWPSESVDHVNRRTGDNRWENLRECTKSQNMANRGTFSNNRLGLKGIRRSPTGKWEARIGRNGKIYLGAFVCPAMAVIVHHIAHKKHFGEFSL